MIVAEALFLSGVLRYDVLACEWPFGADMPFMIMQQLVTHARRSRAETRPSVSRDPVIAIAPAPRSESLDTEHVRSPTRRQDPRIMKARDGCQRNNRNRLAARDIIEAESRGNPYLHSSNRRAKHAIR
jgi:hypothetical protein